MATISYCVTEMKVKSPSNAFYVMWIMFKWYFEKNPCPLEESFLHKEDVITEVFCKVVLVTVYYYSNAVLQIGIFSLPPLSASHSIHF